MARTPALLPTSRTLRRAAGPVGSVVLSLTVFSALVLFLFLVRFVGPLALVLGPLLAVAGFVALKALWIPAPDAPSDPVPSRASASSTPALSAPALCADAAAELDRLEASERSLAGLLAAAEAFGVPAELVRQSQEVSTTTVRSLRSQAAQVSAVDAAVRSAGSPDARTDLAASYLTLLTHLHEGVDAHERLTAAAAGLCSAVTLESGAADPALSDATDVLAARARALVELSGPERPTPALRDDRPTPPARRLHS